MEQDGNRGMISFALGHAPEDQSKPHLRYDAYNKANIYAHGAAKSLLQQTCAIALVIPSRCKLELKLEKPEEWRDAVKLMANEDPVLLASIVWKPWITEYPHNMQWFLKVLVDPDDPVRTDHMGLSNKLRYVYSEAVHVSPSELTDKACIVKLAGSKYWKEIPVPFDDDI